MYIPAFTPILTTADLLLRNAAMENIKKKVLNINNQLGNKYTCT